MTAKNARVSERREARCTGSPSSGAAPSGESVFPEGNKAARGAIVLSHAVFLGLCDVVKDSLRRSWNGLSGYVETRSIQV